MTYEFTNQDWIQTADGHLLMIANSNPYEEKPIIQVYFYPEDTNLTAILTEPRQIQYIHETNSIVIHSNNPFSGYVAIR